MPDGRSRPKYIRIKNAILQEIRDGRLKPGEQVHSISRIMAQFNVSKVTAVRALAELESDGEVRREHGRGTFVEARDLDSAARRRRTVSVIVPDMVNPFHVEVVGALERRLRSVEIAFELSCTDHVGSVEQAALVRAAAEHHVSGVVLIATPVPHDLPADIVPRLPLVAIDTRPPALADKCVFISCDNYRGGFEAATHLASLGHVRIGCIYSAHGSKDRLNGFRQGLSRHGIDLRDDHVLVTKLGATLGTDLLDLVRRRRLTAVFAHNDMLAMQAMQLLRANQYTVPNDISLVGYDDVPATRYLEVPLTTVNQHEELIGRRAAECMIEAFESRTATLKPREIIIVPQLVVRQSTAPPLDH